MRRIVWKLFKGFGSDNFVEQLSTKVGFEKFFDSHMQNYTGKLTMIKWNRFDTGCGHTCIFPRSMLPITVFVVFLTHF